MHFPDVCVRFLHALMHSRLLRFCFLNIRVSWHIILSLNGEFAIGKSTAAKVTYKVARAIIEEPEE